MVKSLWMSVAVLALAGCSMSNGGYLRESLAKLPSGDEINEEAEIMQGFGQRTHTTPAIIVWRRHGSGEQLLAVEGKGEMRVRSAGKVLEMKGDSNNWFKAPGNTQRAVRVSPDGNRAWLVSQGQVVASFDYENGVALFGSSGQPAWATAQ